MADHSPGSFDSGLWKPVRFTVQREGSSSRHRTVHFTATPPGNLTHSRGSEGQHLVWKLPLTQHCGATTRGVDRGGGRQHRCTSNCRHGGRVTAYRPRQRGRRSRSPTEDYAALVCTSHRESTAPPYTRSCGARWRRTSKTTVVNTRP